MAAKLKYFRAGGNPLLGGDCRHIINAQGKQPHQYYSIILLNS
jgi:hypothetical protein